jgi:predicted dinucleotide-utilizing enzyme
VAERIAATKGRASSDRSKGKVLHVLAEKEKKQVRKLDWLPELLALACEAASVKAARYSGR